jgi:hypothetical protein
VKKRCKKIRANRTIWVRKTQIKTIELWKGESFKRQEENNKEK